MVGEQPRQPADPLANDPVSDPPGEAVFFRDEDSGRVWSATPLPAGGGQPYTIRHGQGYSVYEHARDGIESRLLVYVAAAEPVKVFQLTLRNTSKRRRQLSVTLYAEWVLGENRERTGPARRHPPRADDRRAPRVECLPRGVRRPRRLPRPLRRRATAR